jgi:hypothetical protein
LVMVVLGDGWRWDGGGHAISWCRGSGEAPSWRDVTVATRGGER